MNYRIKPKMFDYLLQFRKLLFFFFPFIYMCACENNSSKSNAGVLKNKVVSKNDTLPDAPVFVIKVDDKEYHIAAGEIDTYYTVQNDVLRIDAGNDENFRLTVTVSDVKNLPGIRTNGWKQINIYKTGGDSVFLQPTVELYKNINGIISSWNNLNDGYHPASIKNENAIHIDNIRKTEGEKFIIKGRINTSTHRNVYESSAKDFNQNHKLEGYFVIEFKDSWLQL